MERYFLELSYKGTAYNGWQIQSNAISVQETLQKALSLLLREDITVVGAGRTDTGVHANFYVAHFDLENNSVSLDESFVYHLNAVLPKDIAVYSVYRVDDNMHARFSAIEREYKYYISVKKDPFSIESAYVFTRPLDIESMQKAADWLLKYDDFTSFAKLHTDVRTNICKVNCANFEQIDHKIVFTIRADRFLRNMVRAIVGTLIEVGKGVLSIDDFRQIIEQKDRSAAKSSAQSQGLFLTNIIYKK